MTASDLPGRSQIVQQALQAAGVTANIQELDSSSRTAGDAAGALGCEVGAIASSLVFLADDNPLLVMTSGRHRVDTDLLARNLGVAKIDRASPDRVREATGQAVGGVAPVGHPQPIRTVIDIALQDYSQIWAAGGTPRTVFPLSYSELVTITGGTPIAVASR
jgi:prolyl-tRNA editing enzyme YbaK/EbsC (Cys-tRNA(Pro) deacylase)